MSHSTLTTHSVSASASTESGKALAPGVSVSPSSPFWPGQGWEPLPYRMVALLPTLHRKNSVAGLPTARVPNRTDPVPERIRRRSPEGNCPGVVLNSWCDEPSTADLGLAFVCTEQAPIPRATTAIATTTRNPTRELCPNRSTCRYGGAACRRPPKVGEAGGEASARERLRQVMYRHHLHVAPLILRARVATPTLLPTGIAVTPESLQLALRRATLVSGDQATGGSSS